MQDISPSFNMVHELFDTSNNLTDILLSICILSYNQPEEIERLLTSLEAQELVGVEIVIRDDSSNIETIELAKRFGSTLPIKFYYGEKEGIDRAVLFLTHRARGTFIWWMGDDELAPNAVSSVLNTILSNEKINFIWANYHLIGNPSLAIDLPEDKFFKSRNELLEGAGAALGFVSATIFRREIVLLGLREAENYIGTQFVNLFIVLYAITQPGKLFYLRGPIIICHNATSDEIKTVVTNQNGLIQNQAFQVFGINFSNIVSRFSDSFDPAVLKRVLKKSFGQMWRGVLVGTAGGWDTTQGKRIKLIKNFWQFPESWIAVILFCLPKKILGYLYRGYKLFN
jgi:glycosyltransferase involved in cell wall biosynthesis